MILDSESSARLPALALQCPKDALLPTGPLLAMVNPLTDGSRRGKNRRTRQNVQILKEKELFKEKSGVDEGCAVFFFGFQTRVTV